METYQLKTECRDSNPQNINVFRWNDTPKVCFINFLANKSYLLCVSLISAEALAEKEREGKFTAS